MEDGANWGPINPHTQHRIELDQEEDFIVARIWLKWPFGDEKVETWQILQSFKELLEHSIKEFRAYER